MKLFENPMKDWENAMTEEDIRAMEAKGYDVSGIREKQGQRREEAKEAEARKQEERNSFENPVDLNKLKPYAQTPRDMNSDFFRAVAGREPWLFKDSWRRKYTQAPLIYAAVVQANSDLWMPGNNEYYPAVFVFALDAEHIRNVSWLSEMAGKIMEMKESRQVPSDCSELIGTLRDDSSEFCFPIGKSVCGNADAWCATYKFDKQSELPRKALPSEGIVPFLLKAVPVKQQFVNFKMIPAKFYIG